MNSLLDAIYPNLCIFCGELLEGDFCESCFIKYRAKSDEDSFIATALRYEEEVKNAIWRFKFRSDFFAVRQLSSYMRMAVLDKFPSVKFDYITYVAQTRAKERKRGYDHCKLLAEAVSSALSLECLRTLKKVRKTKDQHDLTFKDRAMNLNNAFMSLVDTNGKTILLIDDVATSGNTIKESVRTLKNSGECTVYSVVAARVSEGKY